MRMSILVSTASNVAVGAIFGVSVGGMAVDVGSGVGAGSDVGDAVSVGEGDGVGRGVWDGVAVVVGDGVPVGVGANVGVPVVAGVISGGTVAGV